MKLRLIITLLAAWIATAAAWGAKNDKVEVLTGTATVESSFSTTLEQSKLEALEKARLDAIGERYGTTMSGITYSTEGNINGKEHSSFETSSMAEVLGEWLGDVGEPEYSFEPLPDGRQLITVTVKFKARPVSTLTTDVQYAVLCNGTSDRFRSTEFRNGDDFFMSFSSPVDGYLAIYLVDTEDEVYTLFPYKDSGRNCAPIDADRSYILFSDKHVNPQFGQVDSMYLTTEETQEVDQLYIVFSPNEFSRVNDIDRDRLKPRVTDGKSFHRWLSKMRSADKEFTVKKEYLTIRGSR